MDNDNDLIDDVDNDSDYEIDPELESLYSEMKDAFINRDVDAFKSILSKYEPNHTILDYVGLYHDEEMEKMIYDIYLNIFYDDWRDIVLEILDDQFNFVLGPIGLKDLLIRDANFTDLDLKENNLQHIPPEVLEIFISYINQCGVVNWINETFDYINFKKNLHYITSPYENVIFLFFKKHIDIKNTKYKSSITEKDLKLLNDRFSKIIKILKDNQVNFNLDFNYEHLFLIKNLENIKTQSLYDNLLSKKILEEYIVNGVDVNHIFKFDEELLRILNQPNPEYGNFEYIKDRWMESENKPILYIFFETWFNNKNKISYNKSYYEQILKLYINAGARKKLCDEFVPKKEDVEHHNLVIGFINSCYKERKDKIVKMISSMHPELAHPNFRKESKSLLDKLEQMKSDISSSDLQVMITKFEDSLVKKRKIPKQSPLTNLDTLDEIASFVGGKKKWKRSKSVKKQTKQKKSNKKTLKSKIN